MWSSLALLVLLAVASKAVSLDSLTDAARLDLIAEGTLPGLSASINFRQFSGYLPVADTGREIFYWFVESQNNPSTDPVLFWTNGGPGCSGLLGFLTEHGPFTPLSDNYTLALNPYSWNLVANVLYVEIPAGVGFSYYADPLDAVVGDDRTATDNYQVLLSFLARYPAFVDSPLYLSAESYGGHYIPTLAAKIVAGNAAGSNTAINFRGLLVGNPYTDIHENLWGIYFTYYGRALISPTTWDAINTACFSDTMAMFTDACADSVADADSDVAALDPYSLDYNTCPMGDGLQSSHLRTSLKKARALLSPAARARAPRAQTLLLTSQLQFKQQRKHYLPVSLAATASKTTTNAKQTISQKRQGKLQAQTSPAKTKTKPMHKQASTTPSTTTTTSTTTSTTSTTASTSSNKLTTASATPYAYDPCTLNYVDQYLNRADVQSALHVKAKTWVACTSEPTLVYSIKDHMSPMEPVWVNLLSVQESLNLNLLIYSGDDDSVCGTAGTTSWVWDLGLNVTSAWAAWSDDEQVAGYVTKFDGLTFATVHSAGHMVPSQKPARALSLLRKFLSGAW